MLFGIAWAVGLLYCFYLLGAKAMDMRRKAIIDANRTRNDIVIDNMREVWWAMGKYQAKTGHYPDYLTQLVDSDMMSQVPINPFTGQASRLIRIGEYPNAGEISVLAGNEYIFNHDTKTSETRSVLTIFCYGEPDEGCSKYADEYSSRKQWSRPDPKAGQEASAEYQWMSPELADTVLSMHGSIGIVCAHERSIQLVGRFPRGNIQEERLYPASPYGEGSFSR
ncbi:hypothetical protein KDL29_09680 [bacterium]|nr:hypothetical protein [bacterium]